MPRSCAAPTRMRISVRWICRRRDTLPACLALSGADIDGAIQPVPCAAQIPDMKPAARPVLARDRVRFVGEAVAVVVASDRYAARDALDLIEVDYEPLTPIVNPEKAIAKGAAPLHAGHKDNVAFKWELEGGDLKAAFKSADKVIRQRIVNQRLIPVPIETRGVIADYQPGEGQLTVWSATQIPHLLRTQIASMLNFPETLVRVVAPEVGGGFGSKLNVYPEEALVAYLAIQLGKPVKWSESRRENFQATIHGRDQIDDFEVAVKRDGTILGLRCRVIADLGAYYQLLTPLIPTLTGLMMTGCYKIRAARMEITGVFTNKMATDAYRGAGRPEATYLIEREMDLVAAELKKDPLEVRRKNFPEAKDFPYATPTGLIYDSGDYEKALDMAVKVADYKKLRQEQAKLRKEGRYMGIGVSTYVEICGMGPSSAMPAGGWESATVRVEPTGRVSVMTGSSPHGQGQETTFAQMGADVLGFDPERMVFADGKISAKESPKKSVAFGQAVSAAYVAKTLPADMEPGLEATTFFEPSNFTYPFGTHICVVEIDSETGDVKLVRYVAVDDCGNVLNPLLVEGQVQGGIVQSVGQALFEEAVYDEQGQLITGELMDYALPRASDMCWIETARTVTPTPVNPLGVKGVGEAGTIGATPALAGAVADALAPFGVHHVDMPFKREKIWQVMRKGAGRVQ